MGRQARTVKGDSRHSAGSPRSIASHRHRPWIRAIRFCNVRLPDSGKPWQTLLMVGGTKKPWWKNADGSINVPLVGVVVTAIGVLVAVLGIVVAALIGYLQIRVTTHPNPSASASAKTERSTSPNKASTSPPPPSKSSPVGSASPTSTSTNSSPSPNPSPSKTTIAAPRPACEDKTLRPKENESYYSEGTYAVVSKVRVECDKKVIKVWFDGYGEVANDWSCLREPNKGDISAKNEPILSINKLGVHSKGTVEFPYEGHGRYSFNYQCDDSWTDAFLFRE